MNLIIATRRNYYNAFGIRSKFIKENLEKYLDKINMSYNIIVVDTFELVNLLEKFKLYEKFDILFLTPSNDLRDIFAYIKSLSKGKIMYCTASIGIWEQPKWAIDIREQFDYLFIGCAGPENIELECCEDLDLPFSYTPFGVDIDSFIPIEFDDKMFYDKISVLIEDSNKGKDDVTLYTNMIKKHSNSYQCIGWDSLGHLIGDADYNRFGKTSFSDQWLAYRRAKFFLNGIPRMEKAVEQWYPGKTHLKNMAIYDNRILEAMASGCEIITHMDTIQPELLYCKWGDKTNITPLYVFDHGEEMLDISLYSHNKVYDENVFNLMRNHAKNYDWNIVFPLFWINAFEKAGIL